MADRMGFEPMVDIIYICLPSILFQPLRHLSTMLFISFFAKKKSRFKTSKEILNLDFFYGAGDETRTRDNLLGRQKL